MINQKEIKPPKVKVLRLSISSRNSHRDNVILESVSLDW